MKRSRFSEEQKQRAESINNPYGAGSKYAPDSPNNPYGNGMRVCRP